MSIDIERTAQKIADDLFEVGREPGRSIYRIQFMSGRLGNEEGCGGLDKGAFIQWLCGALTRSIPRPTTQAAPEWDGEGLPPVGCECEMSLGFTCGIRAKITYMGDGVFCYRNLRSGSEYTGSISDAIFRPPPHQRAAAKGGDSRYNGRTNLPEPHSATRCKGNCRRHPIPLQPGAQAMTEKTLARLVSVTVFAVVLFAFMYSQAAKADIALHGGGLSYHVATGHKVDYTNTHDLIGLEVGPALVATFRNSYGRRSELAGYGFTKDWGHWRGSVYVGAVRGYRSCYGDNGDKARVCPMAFPSLHYTRYRVQPGVLLFGEAVVFTVRVRL